MKTKIDILVLPSEQNLVESLYSLYNIESVRQTITSELNYSGRIFHNWPSFNADEYYILFTDLRTGLENYDTRNIVLIGPTKSTIIEQQYFEKCNFLAIVDSVSYTKNLALLYGKTPRKNSIQFQQIEKHKNDYSLIKGEHNQGAIHHVINYINFCHEIEE